MFDNDIFEKWLDDRSEQIVDKMGRGEQLRTEDMIVLVLKAQSNHFHHLDRDLRNEIGMLRSDFQNEIGTLRSDFQNEMKVLREDMDKRFEGVDKRFESMDKRFEQMMQRIDRFMFWSLGITVAAAVFVVNYLK